MTKASEASRRRGFLKFGVASGAGLMAPSLLAHEYFTTHFTLVHPWTRASAPGATTAKICMKFEDVRETDYLIGASTPLAEGARGGGVEGGGLNLMIPAGKTTEFTEAGEHLLLVGLTSPLLLGRELPMTLTFAKSGILRATFLVDYAAA